MRYSLLCAAAVATLATAAPADAQIVISSGYAPYYGGYSSGYTPYYSGYAPQYGYTPQYSGYAPYASGYSPYGYGGTALPIGEGGLVQAGANILMNEITGGSSSNYGGLTNYGGNWGGTVYGYPPNAGWPSYGYSGRAAAVQQYYSNGRGRGMRRR